MLKSTWNRIRGLRWIYVFMLSVTLSHEASNLKSLIHDISHENKKLKPQNTHEKENWTHEIPTRKHFGPTKYTREKILDPRNTHGKNYWTHTKYQSDKISDPRNTRKGTITRWYETHETHNDTWPTKFRTFWWPITTTTITSRNTFNKKSPTNEKVLLTHKKSLLQDLLKCKKDLLTYTKNLRQIATANSCGKFPRQIPAANSRGDSKDKLSWKAATGIFWGQFPTTNSQIMRKWCGVIFSL